MARCPLLSTFTFRGEAQIEPPWSVRAWSVRAWERARPSSSSFVLEVECRDTGTRTRTKDEDDWRSGASCKVALVSLHLRARRAMGSSNDHRTEDRADRRRSCRRAGGGVVRVALLFAGERGAVSGGTGPQRGEAQDF